MIMEHANRVRFHFLISSFSFQNRNQLKFFVIELFAKEGFKVEHLNFVFCSDEFLLLLNKSHLNHDTYTDIITFPFSNRGEAVLADIYISVERVKENAARFSQSFQTELHRVIFHGVLHLCGYKDKIHIEKKLMREKESYYLTKYWFHVKRI
jgi:rRNA maturation RNase YbeY